MRSLTPPSLPPPGGRPADELHSRFGDDRVTQHESRGPSYGPTATMYAVSAYTPRPKRDRHGVALALSGGGYRAALFHLGALRRLNELGVLTQVDTISSVSGGSILSAHIARRAGGWPQAGTVIGDWEHTIAQPFREFVKHNIRTGPLARPLWPWNWRHGSAGAEALAAKYREHLTSQMLSELPAPPERPRLVFCSSDLTFGVNWIFDSARGSDGQSRVGDYKAGYRSPAPDWPVARAVAASSCFPPVFDPLPGGVPANELSGGSYVKPDRDQLVAAVRLSDGGVYDNLGLEPVWKDHRTLLVSDGGATFEPTRLAGIFWRVDRYTSMIESQARGLRKRWLISNFLTGELDGTYWGVGTPAARYEKQIQGVPREYLGYSPGLVDDVISEIRTDLDAFSDAETRVLENHGYLVTEAALRTHVPRLIAVDAALAVPHDDWMHETRVAASLKSSTKRKLLGRG